VTREPDPGDRRGVLIALTPEGRAVVDRAAVSHLANERRILSGLSAAEQRQLAGLLRKLSITLPDRETRSRPPQAGSDQIPAAADSRSRPTSSHAEGSLKRSPSLY
jgi:hypothetical protein